MKNRKMFSLACAALGFLACGGPERDDGSVEEVVIELTPNGPIERHRARLSLDEQAATQALGFSQRAISYGGGAVTNAMSIYERTNFGGSRLYIYGTPGTLNLATVTRTCGGLFGCVSWANSVRSFIASMHRGYFTDNFVNPDGGIPTTATEEFTLWYYDNSASPLVRAADLVTLAL